MGKCGSQPNSEGTIDHYAHRFHPPLVNPISPQCVCAPGYVWECVCAIVLSVYGSVCVCVCVCVNINYVVYSTP